MDRGAILVDGVPSILLSASVFPFRIARESWRDRLRAVSRLGYDAIDVYIPWNYHEVSPGVWNFDGQHDVDGFLSMAEEEGLYVIARPGPYICGEWDGGALPVWLVPREGARVRQYDDAYLHAVDRWFAQIMPVLARHQTTNGGCVALVQLENELDFFDCDDPVAYMTHLRDGAAAHGIDVPLIACAGQGDISRATGDVAGVVPAVNIYPDDGDREIEQHVAHYFRALSDRGLPMLVTETNRYHRTLKRLVVSGVRLLGPYLQVSGWNFGRGTAINNWGSPLGYMTHDYDFGGAIAPDGTERADAREARRLTGTIRALGASLASSVPAEVPSGVVLDGGVVAAACALSEGGYLLSLANLTENVTSACIPTASGPSIMAEIPALSTRLLPVGIPIPGTDVVIEAATAELVASTKTEFGAQITFAVDEVATVQLRGEGAVLVHAAGATRVEQDDALTIVSDGGHAQVAYAHGSLTVRFVRDAERDVSAARGFALTGAVTGANADAGWKVVPGGAAEAASAVVASGQADSQRLAFVDTPSSCLGVVLRGGLGTVKVRSGEQVLGCRASAGEATYWALDRSREGRAPLTVEVHVWGTSNFDDPRLPALRLGYSMEALRAYAVTERADLTGGWLVRGGPTPIGVAPPPRANLGGWMTATYPQTVVYERDVEHDGGALILHGSTQARISIAVDGRDVGSLNPLESVLWTDVPPGSRRITAVVTRQWGEAVGSLLLLRGVELKPATVAVRDTGAMELPGEISERELTLPLEMPSQGLTWMAVDLPQARSRPYDTVVRIRGEGVLLHAFAAGTWLGRVCTTAPEGATLKGGRGDVVIVPRAWSGPLVLRAEALDSSGGVVTSIEVGAPIDV
jgi:hypothetical protein